MAKRKLSPGALAKFGLGQGMCQDCKQWDWLVKTLCFQCEERWQIVSLANTVRKPIGEEESGWDLSFD